MLSWCLGTRYHTDRKLEASSAARGGRRGSSTQHYTHTEARRSRSRVHASRNMAVPVPACSYRPRAGRAPPSDWRESRARAVASPGPRAPHTLRPGAAGLGAARLWARVSCDSWKSPRSNSNWYANICLTQNPWNRPPLKSLSIHLNRFLYHHSITSSLILKYMYIQLKIIEYISTETWNDNYIRQRAHPQSAPVPCPLTPQQVREASLSCLFSAAAALPRAPRARPLPWQRAPDAAGDCRMVPNIYEARYDAAYE